MPSVVRAIVTIPAASAIPTDASVNVWHFNGITFDDCYDDIYDTLVSFYQDLDSLFSVQTNVSAINVRLYNLSNPEPRVPHLDSTFDAGTAGTDAYPSELALCLSFQGVRESGVDQARRRGRVYLGPLARVATSSTNPVPDPATAAAIAAAAGSMLDRSQGSATYKWGVYSTVDNAIVDVANGWVDNAWDVQRRRGVDPTVRVTFS